MLPGKIKGIIDFSGLPKAVEQNSKLSGNGNDGSIFGVLASTFCELQAPAAKIAVGTEGTQDVVRRANQQSAQEGVAGLGDRELRVAVAGLVASRDEPEGGSDLPALSEAAGVLESQHKGQGGERSHAADLLQRAGLGVLRLAEGFDLAVVGSDLLGESGDHFKEREQRGAQGVWDRGLHLLGEAMGRTGRQAITATLHDPADVIDQQGAGADQRVP